MSNSSIKIYKIIVDFKHFGNMRGYSPAEVAKKAASKILGNSLNRTRFSMVEAKTGKIRHYDAKREKFDIMMQSGKIWFALIVKMEN